MAATVVAAALALIVTLLRTATAATPQDLHHLSFGAPFRWITQDQFVTPPSFPASVHLATPLENPTQFHLWPFVADVACFAAFIVGVTVVRRRQP